MGQGRIPRSLAIAALLGLVAACGGGDDDDGKGKGGGGNPPVIVPVSATVDAAVAVGQLAPLWGDHYDLSYEHLDYAAEPGFVALAQSLQPRSWRCSIGRWEVGLPPPPGGDSTDPLVLRSIEREYYRGPNTLAGADDPLNYDFGYLDAQLAGIGQTGAEPFLCLEFMPFPLSAEQNPLNANNLGLSDPALSYSNGIRTSPPADPAVYARVVRNAIRHVRGLFAGTIDFGITYVEIGNEPDLVDAAGTPLRYFWTGTRQEWIDMYAAIAAEVDADPTISGLVKLGGGSFAFQPSEPGTPFLQDFLVDVALNGRRLDFVSYHSYADLPDGHFIALARLDAALTALGLAPEIVNGEWGRALDGADPVYDRIEHGLLRTRAMIIMQLFGVRIAHEALFRDPAPGNDLLGLVRTGPPATKPVSDVYAELARMNGALQALPITAPNGEFFMAGRDAAGTRVVVVYVADDPGAGTRTDVTCQVENLPWGPASFDVDRVTVSDASHAAGGAFVQTTTGLVGPSATLTASIGPGPGEGAVVIWELAP